MKYELLKSKPTEVALAVPLIYSSGPDAFEYVFQNQNHRAIDFLKFAFVRKGGEFSYQNHYSLYVDDKLVGIGSVFDAVRARKFTHVDAVNIVRFYKLRSPAILKNGLQVEKIIKLPIRQEITLAHLGIDPSYRNKGLGTELIYRLMDQIQPSTKNKFVLDVSAENPRAQSLYERLGFAVTQKMKSTLKNKYSYVPNHLRMELSK